MGLETRWLYIYIYIYSIYIHTHIYIYSLYPCDKMPLNQYDTGPKDILSFPDSFQPSTLRGSALG